MEAGIGVVDTVPEAAARRLSNQIARTYRGTYGAQAGMRTIILSVTRQMLRAGSSPDSVSRALTQYVLAHPGDTGPEPRSAATDALHSSTLIALTKQCVADVERETRLTAR